MTTDHYTTKSMLLASLTTVTDVINVRNSPLLMTSPKSFGRGQKILLNNIFKSWQKWLNLIKGVESLWQCVQWAGIQLNLWGWELKINTSTAQSQQSSLAWRYSKSFPRNKDTYLSLPSFISRNISTQQLHSHNQRGATVCARVPRAAKHHCSVKRVLINQGISHYFVAWYWLKE